MVKIKSLVAVVAKREAGKLTAKHELANDLAIPSIEILSLLMSIEDEFEMDLGNLDFNNLPDRCTIGGLADIVMEKMV